MIQKTCIDGDRLNFESAERGKTALRRVGAVGTPEVIPETPNMIPAVSGSHLKCGD